MLPHWFALCLLLGSCAMTLIEAVPAPFIVEGRTSQRELMLLELDAIRYTFEVRYTPVEWKRQHKGWDLTEEIQKAKQQVMASEEMSQKDFQRLLRRLFKSVCDYHVDIQFDSTESSTLPFRLRGSQGRYFVSSIDNKAPNYPLSPLQLGDELIIFDGLPIHEAICQFQQQEMYEESATGRALAETFLTNRLGSLAHKIPQGLVEIQVRSLKDNQLKEYHAEWHYSPEKIRHHMTSPLLSSFSPLLIDQELATFFCKRMDTPLFEALGVQHSGYERSMGWGQEQHGAGSGMALLGAQATDFSAAIDGAHQKKELEVVWRHRGEKFKACIYKTVHQQRVGYLRLPSYYGTHVEINELVEIIQQLDRGSDLLVIDQTNNPGGYFFYMFAVASLLTSKELVPHSHYQSIVQSDVVYAMKMLKNFESISNNSEARRKIGVTLQGFTVDYEVAKDIVNHFRFIIDQWEQGKRVTAPGKLMGISKIKPHPRAHYSKPILLLVNSLDFSCADFLPAMLQDNGCPVVVMGTSTAGAGGFVLRTVQPNCFAIASYSYTASLALRTDEMPLENRGVTPDVLYEVTPADLQYEYRDFLEALQAQIDQLVPPKKEGTERLSTPSTRVESRRGRTRAEPSGPSADRASAQPTAWRRQAPVRETPSDRRSQR